MACRLADLCCQTASIHEKKSDYSSAFNWLRGGLIAMEGMVAIEARASCLLGAGDLSPPGEERRGDRVVPARVWTSPEKSGGA